MPAWRPPHKAVESGDRSSERLQGQRPVIVSERTAPPLYNRKELVWPVAWMEGKQDQPMLSLRMHSPAGDPRLSAWTDLQQSPASDLQNSEVEMAIVVANKYTHIPRMMEDPSCYSGAVQF